MPAIEHVERRKGLCLEVEHVHSGYITLVCKPRAVIIALMAPNGNPNLSRVDTSQRTEAVPILNCRVEYADKNGFPADMKATSILTA